MHIMSNSEQTPESVRRPVVIGGYRFQDRYTYRVMFWDRGVWEIADCDIESAKINIAIRDQDDMAELFARRPDLFTFIERKAIAHGTNI